MKCWAGVAVVAGALMLAGCSTGGPSENPEESDLNGGFKVGYVQVDGKPLRCVQVRDGRGQSSVGGLSCDWVQYHGLDR